MMDHSVPLRRQLPASFLYAGIGKIAALLLATFLARRLGPHDFGIFAFALGVAALGGRVFALGWPTVSQRLIPEFRAKGETSNLRRMIAEGDRLLIVTSACAGFSALLLASVFPASSHPSTLFPTVALLVPLMVFRTLLRNQLSAFGQAPRGLLLDDAIPPVICLVFVPVIHDADSALLVMGGASGAAVLLGFVWRQGNLPPAGKAKGQADWQKWIAIGVPAMAGMSAKLLLAKADILMLSTFSTHEQTGFYAAALRATFAQTAPVVVIAAALTPALSEEFARANVGGVRRLFWRGCVAAVALACPFALAFSLYPAAIATGLFGAAFAPTGPILSLLALGQVGAALSIVTTALLLMGGAQKTFGWIMGAALAANIALNAVLIPLYGGVGAAMATSIVTILVSLIQLQVATRLISERSIG